MGIRIKNRDFVFEIDIGGLDSGIGIGDWNGGLGLGLKFVYRLKSRLEPEVYLIGCGYARLVRIYSQLKCFYTSQT